jgi:hypothetical protein
VRSQQPLRAGHPTINLFLVRRAVLDRVEERIVVTVDKNDFVSILKFGETRNFKSEYFCEVENIPLSNLTVASQAELISIITPISYSGFLRNDPGPNFDPRGN